MNLDHYKPESSKPGLGCVTFGREIDELASFQIMDYAYLKGIREFDTAVAYGNGLSESIVGKWLQVQGTLDETIIISTKILPPYTPEQIKLTVDESLRRLRKERVDVLYLHRWDESLFNSEAWILLDKLVKGGKVNNIGVSNFNTEQLDYAINIQKDLGLSGIGYLQNNNNFAVSDLNEVMKETCRINNIRIVTFSPLGAGFLTGKHLKQVQEGSRFAKMPAHQLIYFNEGARQRLYKILKIADLTGYSAVHLALAWAFHQKDIYSVLIGGRTIEHLDQAFAAREFYSAKIFSELESV